MQKEQLKKVEQKPVFQELKEYFRNIRRVVTMVTKAHPVLSVTLLSLVFILSFQSFAANAVLAYLLNTLISDEVTLAIVMPALVLYLAVRFLPLLLSSLEDAVDLSLWFRMQHFFVMLMLKVRAAFDVARYEDPEFQDLLQRATERGEEWPFRQLYERFYYSFWSVVGLLTATIALLAIDVRYFLLIVIGTLPVFFVEAKYGRSVYDIFSWHSTDKRRYDVWRRYMYDKTSLTELRLFGATEGVFKKIASIFQRFVDDQVAEEKSKFTFSILAVVWLILLQGTAVVLAVQDAIAGLLGVGTIVFVLALMNQLQESVRMFLMNIAQQRQASLVVTDLFKVIDTKPVITDSKNSVPLAKDSVPAIEFENVWFKYPFGKEEWVLKNLSFTIPAGQKLALIGVNGAGKSTLIKLLCRFYDPTKGRILVNGVDLKEIARDDWYQVLAVLFQDFESFKFLAKEAIALGERGEIEMSKVIEAAQNSNADRFISTWKNGFEEQMGVEFGGTDPSGGQKQRLAIARSFYGDPKILVLDEPTAAVDAEAEAEIFENLEKWAGERTLILISHRFSTVRNVDRILILKNGELIEDGSHDELVEKENGIYATLFKKQAKGYR